MAAALTNSGVGGEVAAVWPSHSKPKTYAANRRASLRQPSRVKREEASEYRHRGRLMSSLDKDVVRWGSAIVTRTPPAKKKTAAATAVVDVGPEATGETSMRVVFVGAEAAPWSKTGGLGEVLGGLPPSMAGNGHRVMTVTPRYDQYEDAWDTSVVVEVKVGEEVHNVRFFHCYKRGVDRVFVDHPVFLEKVWGETGPKLYGPVTGEDYADNTKRFSLLCQAALEAPRVLNLSNNDNYSGPYGEDVVFVCNDWHTAILPCYLKANYQSNGIYRNAKTVLCIHNISYQGRQAFEDYPALGLPDDCKPSFDFVERYLDGSRKMNWMKAGIVEADRVVTVSPYYAQEVVTSQFKGMELENVLAETGITGILNGMDTEEWNPQADKYIPINYDATTVMEAKPIIKEALQAEVGLPVDRSVPLVAFIGRLEEQKGPDILAAALPGFINAQNMQLVALGTGKKKYEEELEEMEDKYGDKARGLTKYNTSLAHLIVAGADYILIPSRFEPCGLIQMEAMQYGTVPIVATTGGLADTVKEGYTGFQMGAFDVDGRSVDPRDVAAVASTVRRAIEVYATPGFEAMIRNCMLQDFSWKEAAKNWERLLKSLEDAHAMEDLIAPPPTTKQQIPVAAF